ncbi:MAG: hypothetical protein GXO97_09635 [Nitrospirae bacterium]|nr:hypothetical protein [Nitrospirota bacterium]
MRKKIYCITFAALLLAVMYGSMVFAADTSSGFVFNAKRASISSMLSNNVDKSVTVVLDSGAKLSGRIVDIKGEIVYLSDERMRGRTNNHVLIRMNSIDALIFDASEFR